MARCCAVGCGVIWRHHLHAVASMEPRRLVYTCVVEPDDARRAAAVEAVRAQLGEEPLAFVTLEDAIQADPTQELFVAVDIMVPNVGLLHEEVAKTALQSRRHVLLEKPISVSVASGLRILAAQEKYAPERVLMVAENAQYWREILEARRLLRSGAIGQVLSVRAKFWESGHPALNEWAADGSYDPGSFIASAAEGFVFDGGLHWLRPLRMFLGQAVRVAAVAGRTLPHMQGPGMAQALICFDSGVTAVFESILAPGAISEQPFFVIQGSSGEIVLDGFAGGGRVYTVAEGRVLETEINADFCGPVGWDTGYAGEVADFAEAVLENRPPAAGPEEAVEDLRLMLAMMKAAKSGQWEAVKELEPQLEMATLGLAL
ncbi:unnamed protein product [Effrenium voratum]|nr:unnamed protein product [Effrenium voratum]